MWVRTPRTHPLDTRLQGITLVNQLLLQPVTLSLGLGLKAQIYKNVLGLQMLQAWPCHSRPKHYSLGLGFAEPSRDLVSSGFSP